MSLKISQVQIRPLPSSSPKVVFLSKSENTQTYKSSPFFTEDTTEEIPTQDHSNRGKKLILAGLALLGLSGAGWYAYTNNLMSAVGEKLGRNSSSSSGSSSSSNSSPSPVTGNTPVTSNKKVKLTEQQLLQLCIDYFSYDPDTTTAEAKANLKKYPKSEFYAEKLFEILQDPQAKAKYMQVGEKISSSYANIIESLGKKIGISLIDGGSTAATIPSNSRVRYFVAYDLAKRAFYADNPDKSSNQYPLGNPLTDPAVQEHIKNTHIGWAAIEDYRLGRYADFENWAGGPSSDIMQLFRDLEGRDRKTWHTYELAKLGKQIRGRL